MTHYDIKRLALVLAVQAEIEGMKAENSIRVKGGDKQRFGYTQFMDKSHELLNLAHAHDEQL